MIRKNMTNSEIYGIAVMLIQEMKNFNASLPVRVNFYLQKNIDEIINLGKDIEEHRDALLDKYGKRDENGYTVNEDQADTLNRELDDLLNLTQEVKIYEIDLSAFDGINLTTS